MREIKFRAWNGEQMVSPDYIDRGGVAYWTEDSIPTRSDNPMQYTGLKDKNGVEIYEGDIVAIKVYDENRRLVGPIERRNGGAYWIKHQEACDKYLHQIHCEVCETTSSVSLLDFFDSYQLNVIGNIHENPELLKQSGDVGND